MAGDLNPISSRSDDLPEADHSQRDHAQQSSAFVHQAEERSASPSHRSQNAQRLTSFPSYSPSYQSNFEAFSKVMPHDLAHKRAEKYNANEIAFSAISQYQRHRSIIAKKYSENGLIPKEEPMFTALSTKIHELLTMTDDQFETQDVYNKLDETSAIAEQFYKHAGAALDKQKEKNSAPAL